MMIGPQTKDTQEMINDFFSTPLFMTEAPKSGEEDPTLVAIQSLLYDGPPQEIAANFKSKGNECMQSGQIREAIKYYTQAIQAVGNDKMKSILYSNRAAAQMKLSKC